MDEVANFTPIIKVVGGILVAIALLIMLASFLLGLTTRLILVGFEWWVWLILILGIILLALGYALSGRRHEEEEERDIRSRTSRFAAQRRPHTSVVHEKVVVEPIREVVVEQTKEVEVEPSSPDWMKARRKEKEPRQPETTEVVIEPTETVEHHPPRWEARRKEKEPRLEEMSSRPVVEPRPRNVNEDIDEEEEVVLIPVDRSGCSGILARILGPWVITSHRKTTGKRRVDDDPNLIR